MQCFNCPENNPHRFRTMYPTDIYGVRYVQKKCRTCGWTSNPIRIPEAI